MTTIGDAIRPSVEKASGRLASANDTKPVIAIMGEFSAGKSTLMNLLLGQVILPTQVTATKLPPVWLSYGDATSYRVDRENVRHRIAADQLSHTPVKDTQYVRLFCRAELLKTCDLLDTPGISDPGMPMESWVSAVDIADAVLWCTHSGQAWRESERSAWESLPERLRKHSLLLITRSDKIVTGIDRQKIDSRMKRETGRLFADRFFISLTDALTAKEGMGNAEVWRRSGAEAFIARLDKTIEAISSELRDERSRRVFETAAGAWPSPDQNNAPGAYKDESLEPLADLDGLGDLGHSQPVFTGPRPSRVRIAVPPARQRLSLDDADRLRTGVVAEAHEPNEPPAAAVEQLWSQLKLVPNHAETTQQTITFDAEEAENPNVAEIDFNNDWSDEDFPLAEAASVALRAPAEEDVSHAQAAVKVVKLAEAARLEDQWRSAEKAVAAQPPAKPGFAPYVLQPADLTPPIPQVATTEAASVSQEALNPELLAETLALQEAAIEPQTASEIWQSILARTRIETVDEVVAAVTELLAVFDRHAGLTGPLPGTPLPTSAEVDQDQDPGWTRLA